MNASNEYPESKGSAYTPSFPALPLPTATAVSTALAAGIAFASGILRGELALTLLGSAFIGLLAYSFLATALLSLLTRPYASRIFCSVSPRDATAGQELRATARIEGGRSKKGPPVPPGALLRCEISLNTEDGRCARAVFPPFGRAEAGFPLNQEGRGAYRAAWDALVLRDLFGFFVARYPLSAETGPRLLLRPLPAADRPLPVLRSGGERRREEPRYRRTEELTDHRPYVFGDDPRRINWKLYGHSEELFVRAGEREPPPRSRFAIILDCSIDDCLYQGDAGRAAVDLLAEHALGISLDLEKRGLQPLLGWSGAAIRPVSGADAARDLCFPAALPCAASLELPEAEEGLATLILAAPRRRESASSLDRFLSRRPRGGVNLLFLYEDQELAAPAAECAARYSAGGVHARCFEA